MTTLTERRAEFVYEGARIAAMAAQAPIIPEPWSEREELRQWIYDLPSDTNSDGAQGER